MSSRGPRETDAVASLAVLRRRFWRPVWATMTNLMKRAFSDEIVLAPKLFLLPSVFVLFLLVDSCVVRRMSVACLLPEDSVISINVTLAEHDNVGHCLFLPYLEDKFMCRLFFFCKIYLITKIY